MRFVLLCLLSCAWALASGSSGARADARAEASAEAEARRSAREQNKDAATLRKVEQWLRQGKQIRARESLARSLRSHPSPLLLTRYAELSLPFVVAADEASAKAQREAARVFLDALARQPETSEALPPELAYAAAWAEALAGDFVASQALIVRYARADDARTLPCLRAVAALALHREQPQVARAVLTLARGFSPSDPELLSEIGLVAMSDGDPQAALSALAERFALDPSSLLARRDLSFALSSVGRPAEAFLLLGVVAGPCGNDPGCLLERARWAFEAGMLAEALAASRLLLEREPEHLDGLFLYADALLAQGELAQARLIYQSILRIAPGNLRAQNALSGLAERVPGAP
jgi:tetratricopeptide (TPR) repeat protein